MLFVFKSLEQFRKSIRKPFHAIEAQFPFRCHGSEILRLSPYDIERGTTVSLLVDVTGGFGYKFFVCV